MRTNTVVVALLFVLANGCASVQVQQENETMRRFFEALRTLGFRELSAELPKIVRAGDPASSYADILEQANETLQKDYGTLYRFWPQPERPRVEYDHWIEIGVDETSKTIKFARPNKYIL